MPWSSSSVPRSGPPPRAIRAARPGRMALTARVTGRLTWLSSAAASPGEPWSRALARTLARWSRSGQLERVVGGWPADVVERWIAAVGEAAEESDEGGDADTSTPQMTGDAVERIAAAVLDERPRTPGRRDAADDLLAAARGARGHARRADPRSPNPGAGAASRPRGQLEHRRRAQRARSGPPKPGGRPPCGRASRRSQPAPRRAARSVAGGNRRGRMGHGPRGVNRSAATGGAGHAALPLLVLAQLSLIGYVDAISATAGAARLPRAAGALAGGLACKVLPAAWS